MLRKVLEIRLKHTEKGSRNGHKVISLFKLKVTTEEYH